jgi:hypothetical protein
MALQITAVEMMLASLVPTHFARSGIAEECACDEPDPEICCSIMNSVTTSSGI